jgi:hypothetical protein
VNPIADFDVCNKKNPMNISIKGKIQQSKHLYKPVKMNGIFANYTVLMNYVLGKHILNHVNFPAKIQI